MKSGSTALLRNDEWRRDERLRDLSEYQSAAELPKRFQGFLQSRRAAVSDCPSERRAVDEADRVHAAGRGRLFAAGERQPSGVADEAGAHGGTVDDSPGGSAGDNVTEGVSGDPAATGKWERAGVARIQDNLEDAAAAVGVVPGGLFG